MESKKVYLEVSFFVVFMVFRDGIELLIWGFLIFCFIN